MNGHGGKRPIASSGERGRLARIVDGAAARQGESKKQERGSKLRTALTGGVSNRSWFYDDRQPFGFRFIRLGINLLQDHWPPND
jgi:hypothetical protein